ncbi:TetR family transcriptional regulator [Streptomyces sp. NBC_01497]|uniref:TetR family transcriptional regulator n=1 Tax=Streptomyces sp. NBC_01497 TaxID=2903885 RepID=UPI002E36B234|nr:TetR family transcriptional regulator [Streptomyces sp. NBC_01497]
MRASGEATRQRILEAAKQEFSRHGLAGARINRIATEARAGKERLYAYFPSKETLFAAVGDRLIADVAGTAALRGEDLPGYVGALFDVFVEDPNNARLHDWYSLQAGGDVPDAGGEARLQPKIDMIGEARLAGHVDPSWNPVGLMLLLIDIARTLAIPHAMTEPLARADGEPSDVATRRREAVAAARRLIAPAGPAPAGGPAPDGIEGLRPYGRPERGGFQRI